VPTGAEPRARPVRVPLLLPDEPLTAAAGRALAFGTEALMHEVPAAEAGDVEAIHQLRVATRRIRAAIELFAPVLHGTRVRLWRRDLGWIATQAGAVRECDVIPVAIRNREDRIDPQLGAALGPVYDSLTARRAAELAKLKQSLGSQRFVVLIDRLGKPVFRKVAPDAKLGPAAATLLRPVVRAVTRAGANLGEEPADDRLHRLRVRIKRLRYSFEMLAAFGGKRLKKTLSRLRDLQELLGECNDVAVTIAYLRSYAASSGAPPETVLGAGALIQSLAGRRRKLVRRALRAWQRLDRGGRLAATVSEIAAVAEKPPPAAETAAVDAA
jgi:CHAD domain-containing protein